MSKSALKNRNFLRKYRKKRDYSHKIEYILCEMSKERKLTELESRLLNLLFRKRYGYEIASKYTEETGSKILLGTLYRALSKLEDDGLIDSEWGDPQEDRGGARRRYYWIVAPGKKVLREFQTVQGRFQQLGLAKA